MEKSYVSMEQKICPICGVAFDSGAILLDRHIRNSLEPKTITGWEMCEEHQARFHDGYIALIEAKAPAEGQTLQFDTAERLGRIFHVREKAWPFDIPPRDVDGNLLRAVFIEPAVADMMEKAYEESQKEE